jgi:hypothetical protein
MSVEAAPTHPFSCYTLDEQGERKTLVGGSYDNISAVTIAVAVYGAQQDYSPSTWRKVAVFDDSDKIIAFVGGYDEEAG